MKHEIKLNCEKSRLVDLRAFLNKILAKTTLTEITKNQVILAVDEVCSNLIIHSHDCNPQEQIALEVTDSGDQLVFEIKDHGEGFNILEYQQPELKAVKKERRKGGLGIMLVRKIMDGIEFESSGNQNTCRLIKHINSK
jgi:serine/threonine-protein kinase RsbW